MSKTMKNIPKVRFPEFINDVEWQEYTLIDTVDKKIKWSFIGGPFGSNLKSSDYTMKGIRVIQLQNIGDGEFNNEYKIYTSEEKANELLSNNIFPNEIILSKMGDPVARACLIPNSETRYVMCSDGIRLVINEKKFNKFFIFSVINSDLFRNLAEKSATGSTRKRIGLDDLKKLPIFAPKISEQQKIAECLSSVDALISAQSSKVEALKAHKKALMQQLFPVEGETTPRLRLPEFKNDGAWKEKKLGEIGVFMRGITYSSDNVSSNGLLVLRSSNIQDNSLVLDKDLVYIEKYCSEELLLQNGDIVICMSNGSKPLVGKSAVYNGNYEAPITIGAFCSLFRPKTNLAKYIFQTESYQKFVALSIGGGNINNLKNSDLEGFPILIPNSQEQQKIAECLSSLDALISAQSSKIEALKQHKKALMQQLFPKDEDK